MNFKKGDIITIITNHNNIERKTMCVFKSFNDESNNIDFYFAIEQNEKNYYIIKSNCFILQNNFIIKLADEKELNLFFHELKKQFEIENKYSIKYLTDSTNMEIADWIGFISNIENIDDGYPNFVYNIKDNIWNIIIEEEENNKFNPKNFKHFDKVIVRGNESNSTIWEGDFFMRYINDDDENNILFKTISGIYKECIPYNNNTKHLIGTKKLQPKFYRF